MSQGVVWQVAVHRAATPQAATRLEHQPVAVGREQWCLLRALGGAPNREAKGRGTVVEHDAACTSAPCAPCAR